MKMKRLLAKKSTITIMLNIIIVISIVNLVFLRLDYSKNILRSNCVLGISSLRYVACYINRWNRRFSRCSHFSQKLYCRNIFDKRDRNIILVIVVGVLSGAAMGLINDLLIAKLGIVKYTTNGTWITNLPYTFIQFG